MIWSAVTWLFQFLCFLGTPNMPILLPFQEQCALSPIQNSTLGFQKVYTLNLPARSDRRDAIALMSSLTGFAVEFVAGVSRYEISERAIPENVRSRKAVLMFCADSRPAFNRRESQYKLGGDWELEGSYEYHSTVSFLGFYLYTCRILH
jgi:hypothetical protein